MKENTVPFMSFRFLAIRSKLTHNEFIQMALGCV